MIEYIIKSSLSLILLFGLYWFLLRKEKLFVFNRYFLVLSVVFSLTVPFISIPVNFQVTPYLEDITPVQDYIIPEISADNIISPDVKISQQYVEQQSASINISAILRTLYILGTMLFLTRLLRNTYILIRRIKMSEKISFEGYKLILTNDKIGPCCFFSSILLNREDYLNDSIDRELINHEIEHARQFHTIDIILIELVKIFYWFNPVHYLYDRAIRINHEYLADNGVISGKSNIKNYADKLLSFISCRSNMSLTSGSNHSYTKMRLMMMMKTRSRSFIYGVRIAITLCTGTLLFLLLSFTESDTQTLQSNISKNGNRYENNTVRGIVVNEEGDPIKDATVIISGTFKEVSTDATGAFTIGDVPEDGHLIISSRGCVSKYLEPVFGSELAIKMSLDNGNPESLLIRASFKNGPYPLIIIDGAESNKRIDEIDENNIKAMGFLLGKNAEAMYGYKGRDGVIIVSLKKDISSTQTAPAINQNLVKGIVVREDGTPIKGVNISSTGTLGVARGTSSDNQGRFILSNVQEDAVLGFFCRGYKSQSLKPDFLKEMRVTMIKDPEYKEKDWSTAPSQPGIPLTVLDGVITKEPAAVINSKLGTDLGTIIRLDPKEATKKYGEAGKYGATEIYTRKKAAELGIKVPYLRQGPEDFPTFQDGSNLKFAEWIAGQIKYPTEAASKNISGHISVEYTVQPDGSLTEIKPMGNPEQILTDAVIKAVQSAPKWDPAKNTTVKDPYSTFVNIKFELPDKVTVDNTYVMVEQMPKYPGGDKALLDYITENIKYPEALKSEKITGRVIVRFIVNSEGNVEDEIILKGIQPLLDAEALRVVRSIKGWLPGIQDGKPVNVWYMVPVNFALPSDTTINQNTVQTQSKELVVLDGLITNEPIPALIKRMGTIGTAKRLVGQEATDKYGEAGKYGVFEIYSKEKARELKLIPFYRSKPEDFPTFQGKSYGSFNDYVVNHTKYPREATVKRIQGRVWVNYTIEEDGSISKFNLMGKPNPLLGEAVIETVQDSPKWESAKNPAAYGPFTSEIIVKFELPNKVLMDDIYLSAEKMPQYPGGETELLKFISTNAKYPESAKFDNAQGKVIVCFVVNTEGNVENAVVLEGVNPTLDAEALRVVNLLKGFTPGSQNGKPVNVYNVVPITFTIK